ncbi:uncharacterized protein L969DRAFT_515033 [Mixia osmundae IAM 14324]|uniref:Uncharacterized protein n=1 Tax=Mixia osmundae (strain CBS 9802 / IAM 14324 / JCM 22182 / KY 12970) TaxID=764103 RepID=G7E6N2_MIXOS|nr:uncharacterized protein L969DRAFT_515033 [Mixia osmundae IAM 14324]KEI39128.1 hypothetical protein L969DRAFT_515033 [Mixia osmundae IAM 14324]GAA98492.1 hypothetical protein E5Q_05178 [Mixia osmundae IAM 14324]
MLIISTRVFCTLASVLFISATSFAHALDRRDPNLRLYTVTGFGTGHCDEPTVTRREDRDPEPLFTWALWAHKLDVEVTTFADTVQARITSSTNVERYGVIVPTPGHARRVRVEGMVVNRPLNPDMQVKACCRVFTPFAFEIYVAAERVENLPTESYVSCFRDGDNDGTCNPHTLKVRPPGFVDHCVTEFQWIQRDGTGEWKDNSFMLQGGLEGHCAVTPEITIPIASQVPIELNVSIWLPSYNLFLDNSKNIVWYQQFDYESYYVKHPKEIRLEFNARPIRPRQWHDCCQARVITSGVLDLISGEVLSIKSWMALYCNELVALPSCDATATASSPLIAVTGWMSCEARVKWSSRYIH